METGLEKNRTNRSGQKTRVKRVNITLPEDLLKRAQHRAKCLSYLGISALFQEYVRRDTGLTTSTPLHQ